MPVFLLRHLSSAGSGTRTNGTYYNVKLYNEDSYSTWNGATAIVSISSNAINVSKFKHLDPDIQMKIHSSLIMVHLVDNQMVQLLFQLLVLQHQVGDVVQVTGIATIADAYYRITRCPGANKISVAKTSGDPSILEGSILLPVDLQFQ